MGNGETKQSVTDLDAKLQDEIEHALQDVTLMEMVDPQTPSGRNGDQTKRKGTVAAIQGEDILIDLGGKSTGVLPIKQLGDEPLPAVGDVIEVNVTGYNEDEGLVMLSRKDAVMAATWATLETGQLVEGKVTALNQGGLEMKVDGIKAFMPLSHIDRGRVETKDLPAFLHRNIQCKVIEVRRSEKSLVLSRRKLLDEEAQRQGEKVLASLAEGQRIVGTVKSIMPYGAFVDLGGIDGLLHVKDMGYGRIQNPNQVVSEGQQLEVMVLKVEHETQRIALGLKQTMADPWEGADSKWPADTVVSGTVTKLMNFGAFVELEEGIEGLIPTSELSYERRIHHPKEVVQVGELVKVRVLSVDPGRQRISLSIKQMGEDPWQGASVRWPKDSVIEGTVRRLTTFGAFVELTPGVEGLIHISEISANHVRSVGDVIKEGDQVEAKVLSVDEDRRRIGLSIKQGPAAAAAVSDNGAESTEPAQKKTRKKPLRGGLPPAYGNWTTLG
jgi:small subunit ribosomal protein S1